MARSTKRSRERAADEHHEKAEVAAKAEPAAKAKAERQKPDVPRLLYSMQEAAAALNVSVRTLERKIAAGLVPVTRGLGGVRISVKALERAIAENTALENVA